MADKTATIKLRLSDDEKANWEAQADADGVTLSSLIRHRMNHPTTRADGVLETAPPDSGSSPVRRGCAADGTPCTCAGPCLRLSVDPDERWAAYNQQLDGTNLIDNAIALLAERRGSTCEHGRPSFVFCSTCDHERA